MNNNEDCIFSINTYRYCLNVTKYGVTLLKTTLVWSIFLSLCIYPLSLLVRPYFTLYATSYYENIYSQCLPSEYSIYVSFICRCFKFYLFSYSDVSICVYFSSTVLMNADTALHHGEKSDTGSVRVDRVHVVSVWNFWLGLPSLGAVGRARGIRDKVPHPRPGLIYHLTLDWVFAWRDA